VNALTVCKMEDRSLVDISLVAAVSMRLARLPGKVGRGEYIGNDNVVVVVVVGGGGGGDEEDKGVSRCYLSNVGGDDQGGNRKNDSPSDIFLVLVPILASLI
jgi:hypothetical protein